MRLAVPMALAVLGIVIPMGCTLPKGDHSGFDPRYASLESARPSTAEEAATESAHQPIKNVFVIVMENHDWDEISGSPSAPYINGTLLREGAHAEAYTSIVHPSEPNYIWMEAGSTLGISDNDDPALNYRTTKAHMTAQLDAAGISWKSYQEGIDGTDCPLSRRGLYAPKHNPMLYFDGMTDGRQQWSAKCMQHVRPYEELEKDLAANTVPRYVFVTPDLCHDMHNDVGCETPDSVKNGDLWLSREVPKILASKAYQDAGALFITWDENEGGHGEAIGMIVMSRFAKAGYENRIVYSHSSLVRTVQDIFGVRPYLRDAANATALHDLFVP